MKLSTHIVGTQLPTTTMTLERGRLRLFSKATGQSDPVYTDVEAAHAAGHPDLPAPPTFLAAIQHERPEPLQWLVELGIDLRQVLHGEQTFVYHHMVYAGDELTLTPRITDYATKKNGVLELITRHSHVTNSSGHKVADLSDVIVVRHRQVNP